MLLRIVGIFFISPIVTGQTESFEQECSILKTLETLEARLGEQQALLREQNSRLEEHESLLLEQTHLLDSQKAEIESLRQQTSGNSPFYYYCSVRTLYKLILIK